MDTIGFSSLWRIFLFGPKCLCIINISICHYSKNGIGHVCYQMTIHKVTQPILDKTCITHLPMAVCKAKKLK